MRIALKTTLFLILTAFSFSAGAAQLCRQAPLEEGQESPEATAYNLVSEFATLAQELNKKHFKHTDQVPQLNTEINRLLTMSLMTRDLVQTHVSSWSPQQANEAISNYLVGLSQLSAVELNVRGSSRILNAKEILNISALQYYKAGPTVVVSVPGAAASFKEGRALIRLNTASKFSNHLTALSRIQMPNRNKQYFETIRCIMGKTLIEKTASYASFIYQKPNIDLSDFEACKDFPMEELLENSDFSKADEMFARASKLFSNTNQERTDEDREVFREIAIEYGYESLLQLIAAAAMEIPEDQPDLKIIDDRVLEIEENILSADPLMEEILTIVKGTQSLVETELQKCDTEKVELKNFEKIVQRNFIANFNTILPMLTAFIHMKPDETDTALQENLAVLLLQFVDAAYSAELIIEGKKDFDDLLHTNNIVNSVIVEEINKQLKEAGIADKLMEALLGLPVDTKPSIVSRATNLVDYSVLLKLYLSKDTPKEDIPFQPKAIGKLFTSTISHLGNPFSYHLNQMISRNTHADRRANWLQVKTFLEEDQAKHNYKCVDTPWYRDLQNGASSFFGLGRSTNHARQNACYTVVRIAKHYGLDLAEEPKSLADVWPSFKNESMYNGGDLKTFEENYRKFISAQIFDTYRILEIELGDLNLESDRFKTNGLGKNPKVYNFVAENSAESILVEELLTRAFNYSRAQLDLELLTVMNSEKLEDLHPYISNSLFLDQLLDVTGLQSYVPGALARDLGEENPFTDSLWPSLYQHHISYRSELNRSERIEKQMNKVLISKLNMPILFLGGAWVTRAILIRTPMLRGVGALMYSAAQSSRMAIGGYMNFLTWVFAGAFVNANATRMDINMQLGKIKQMKFADAIAFDGDVPLTSYDAYLTKNISLNLDKDDAVFDMWLFGGFTAFSAVMSVASPFIASRSATQSLAQADPSKLSRWANSNSFLVGMARQNAKLDRNRLSWSLKQLGNPKSFDLSTLQAARANSVSQHANEAYNRIIFLLGQRVNGAIGYPAKEQAVAKELFGNSASTHQLREISTEYARLFPDVVRGL